MGKVMIFTWPDADRNNWQLPQAEGSQCRAEETGKADDDCKEYGK